MSSGVRRIIAPYITTISVHYLRFDRPPTEIKQPMNILLLKIEDLMTEELTYEATHAITAHWCQSGSWTTVYGNLINAMYVFSHGSFHTHTERERENERDVQFSPGLCHVSRCQTCCFDFFSQPLPQIQLYTTPLTPSKRQRREWKVYTQTFLQHRLILDRSSGSASTSLSCEVARQSQLNR